MKKVLTFIFVSIFSISIFGQRLAFTVGATTGYYPKHTCIEFTGDASIGCYNTKGIYMGIGISPGYVHPNNLHGCVYNNDGDFIMPIYAQISYIKSNKPFFDMKFGYAITSEDGGRVHGMSLRITPIGYTFSQNNSIGIGYQFENIGPNYHSVNFSHNHHSVTISYQHLF